MARRDRGRLTAVEFKDPNEELKPADFEVQKKIKDIEAKLAGMKTSDPKHKPVTDDRAMAMVVSGVGEEGGEVEAMAWVSRQIASLEAGTVKESDIYFKGGTFKGMLFCKFSKPEAADKAIKTLSKSSLEFQAGTKHLRQNSKGMHQSKNELRLASY